jgi:hypothetical protein
MFGKSYRGPIGSGGWAFNNSPFYHKSHYQNASEFIEFDRRVRAYMRQHNCDVYRAIAGVRSSE